MAELFEEPSLITNAAEAAQPPLTIYDLLRKRHPAGEWAFLEEVAQRPIGGRFADAIAINLWSSRGYAIHGFEVKVSRSDWLRELKQPEKAEPIFRYCNYWYLVAERDVVRPGELPDAWGHLERRGRSLHVVKAAPKLKPHPVSLEFFASLIRRAHEQIDAIAAKKHQLALLEAKEAMDKTIDDEVKRRMRQNVELQKRVEAFEAATGMSIDGYGTLPISTIKLAQRMHSLQGWQQEGALHRLAELATGLDRAAADVRKALDATGLTP